MAAIPSWLQRQRPGSSYNQMGMQVPGLNYGGGAAAMQRPGGGYSPMQNAAGPGGWSLQGASAFRPGMGQSSGGGFHPSLGVGYGAAQSGSGAPPTQGLGLSGFMDQYKPGGYMANAYQHSPGMQMNYQLGQLDTAHGSPSQAYGSGTGAPSTPAAAPSPALGLGGQTVNPGGGLGWLNQGNWAHGGSPYINTSVNAMNSGFGGPSTNGGTAVPQSAYQMAGLAGVGPSGSTMYKPGSIPGGTGGGGFR